MAERLLNGSYLATQCVAKNRFGLMKSILILISAVALFGVTGKLLVSPKGQDGADDSHVVDALPVQTIELKPVSSIIKERQFTGTLVAARRSRLAFARSARLMKVLVDDGAAVAEGQVLAEIDRRQLEAQIADLQARIRQQGAILQELVAGPRAETIATARANLAASTADLELSKATLNRVQDLQRRGATSAQNLDEVRLAWHAAVATCDSVAMQLEELEAGTRKEQTDAQKAVVAGLEAQLSQLQIDDADSELKAPFAGTIVQRSADEGDMLSAQQPVFTLLESDHMEARIGVPSSLAGSLDRDGYYILSANGAEVTGRIRSVLSEVNPTTRTQLVILELDSGQASQLQPGQLADGQLVRMKFDEVLQIQGYRVPVSALASGARGLWTVYVVEAAGPDSGQKVVTSRAVEVLHTDGSGAIIRGAVYTGERLVSDGVHRVVPGQVVIDAGTVDVEAINVGDADLADDNADESPDFDTPDSFNADKG